MDGEYPLCPECGAPLSVTDGVDEVTGNIFVMFFCAGPADDVYVLKIDTHLCNEELRDWNGVGSKNRQKIPSKTTSKKLSTIADRRKCNRRLFRT